jgi:hypothetical protein
VPTYTHERAWNTTACAIACRWLLAAAGCDDEASSHWQLDVRHTIDGWHGVQLRFVGGGGHDAGWVGLGWCRVRWGLGAGTACS